MHKAGVIDSLPSYSAYVEQTKQNGNHCCSTSSKELENSSFWAVRCPLKIQSRSCYLIHHIRCLLQFSSAWPAIVWVRWWDYVGFVFVSVWFRGGGLLKLQLWQRNAASVTSWALVGAVDPLLSPAFKTLPTNRTLATAALLRLSILLSFYTLFKSMEDCCALVF